MSVRIMSLVWALDLPDSQKIVLLALADNANDEGVCWPSMATIAKKCSKSDRTVQGVIKQLCAVGHLTRKEVVGKGCSYTVHPRSDCAPQELHPRRERHEPPQPLRHTPAAAADKPSYNHQEPPREKISRARSMPDNWIPSQFGIGTKSRIITDGWTQDEWQSHLEHFTAHHRARGSKFKDWQDAWSTWVLNSAKYGRQVNGTANRASNQQRDGRSSLARAIDEGLDWLDGTQASFS